MPGQPSEVPSTLAPSDSASAAGSRKSKPGKAERAARRSATGAPAGQPANAAKAMTFASGVSAPKPMPGKFPVVFQTGAGEPSRDHEFSVDPNVLASTVNGFPDRLTRNPKYAEFLSYTELEDYHFHRQLKSATILRLAQQVVHSHINMGLPQGDFSPVASTEVRVPASVASFVSQFGEFSVPALGTRFLYKDYPALVKSLVFTADQLSTGTISQSGPILQRLWLPTHKTDGHTKQIIASRLNQFVRTLAGVTVSSTVLEEAVLSGTRPDAWDNIKDLLGDDDASKDRFDFLFAAHRDAPSFVTSYTSATSSAVLQELNLHWTNPSAAHVDWTYNAKENFTRLSDEWARLSASYAQFFEMSSSQSNRQAATGSQSQLATVSINDSVTVVKTFLALSAPEFSLVACFPASGLFSDDVKRNVVVTTPLAISQRATEFVQLDWR